ncbi:MAG: DUF4922 domain-containing protein [Prevotellaceae bacterium]|nr:DUF4922 domain-containing protein [Prevotellaceae bacterium]
MALMNERIDCFIPRRAEAKGEAGTIHTLEGDLGSTAALEEIALKASTPLLLLCRKAVSVELGYQALKRWTAIAEDTGALMLYADHYELSPRGRAAAPVTDWQLGSVRDGFRTGSLWLLRLDALKAYLQQERLHRYRYAALYDLSLFISRRRLPLHVRELLYSESETDTRDSGKRQFDYLDPQNRPAQREMERALTRHLREIGAYLSPGEHEDIVIRQDWSGPEASVVIPVRNRVRTIEDALRSALGQQTDFSYNVLVVDNHSTDGTTEVIERLAKEAKGKIIHLQPEREDLGIGGCWNLALHDPRCGQFAVQLDSDDAYSSPLTLAKVVSKFHEEKAAMVIGSYSLCDFSFRRTGAALIDHSEWTADNGRNNALRVNGLGAPRAFHVPELRQWLLPNTSYGEDYAIGLALSRRYRISRIYEELYLCRRWEGNSDAKLDCAALNRNDEYKDSLRTAEILARQRLCSMRSRRASEEEVSAFHALQLERWAEARQRYDELERVETRELSEGDISFAAQWNPARIVSTGADVRSEALEARPCFLCKHNRPALQAELPVERHYDILVNPFPILPGHLTIATRRHQPQSIYNLFPTMRRLAWDLGGHIVFYNGPLCGASRPDHCHLQAALKGALPIERDWTMYEPNLQKLYPLTDAQEAEVEEAGGRKGDALYLLPSWLCPVYVIKTTGEAGADSLLFRRLYHALPLVAGEMEPRLNAIAWRQQGLAGREDEVTTLVFPRKKHRPECYSELMVSPGALDMGGLLVLPREKDFRSLTPALAKGVIEEVALSKEELEQVNAAISGSGQPQEEAKEEEGIATPEVRVGIMTAERLRLRLNGSFRIKGETITGEQTVWAEESGINWEGSVYRELSIRPLDEGATFTLHGVTIGKGFHWQRRQEQTFQGQLSLVMEERKIVAINVLPVEQYLTSVISSEMKDTCPLEFLKASAVISRSWLLAQLRRKGQGEGHSFFQFKRTETESIRWHDRGEHTLFDVCADDHCQRYQGVTRATGSRAAEAVRLTSGEILTSEGEPCDARFSKCCGGVTNSYPNCWEDIQLSYLRPVRDLPPSLGRRAPLPDLSGEEAAREWILSRPQSLCDTRDEALLASVLNDYDRESGDFFRWRVEYSQEELRAIVTERLGLDLGAILAIKPLERSVSGHLVTVQIVGTERAFTVGKELEVRRTLSKTHLRSSAFVVDTEAPDEQGIPQHFVIHGAGWGHGVGMCQIGAAAMASRGFSYQDILRHYYDTAAITKLY